MVGGVATVCASMIQGPLSATCREMVKGVFAGHVHTAASTTSELFTLVPAVTQAVPQLVGRTGFFLATVSEAAPEIKVDTRTHLYTYNDSPGHIPDKTKWSRDQFRLRVDV